jgi:hypothetical protein
MKTIAGRILFTIAAALAAFACATAEMRAQGRPQEIRVHGSNRPAGGEYALTFSAPVALPGTSLSRGTYIFHSPAEHVVRVTSADGGFNSMFSTVPTTRTQPTDHYSIVLAPPSEPDAPRRIVAIFAPGELTGEQFVYPKR